MKRNKITVLLIAVTLIVGQAFANNITIDSNPQPVNEDPANQYMDIQFDISWDNSWRTSSAPNNWDAAWVFIKYKIGDDGLWKHCKLSSEAADHGITNENGVAATIQGISDSTGVFMYRTNDGSGSINWDGVELLWDYSNDPDVGTDYIEFKVFALEMVYVPQSDFYLGDGAGVTAFGALGRFHPSNDTNATFHVTNENGFYLGGYRAENLSANDDANAQARTDDDFGGDDSVYLPDEFPKGYNAFYCMKYELSQQGYVDFLNTLTREQQNRNTETDISGTSITNRYVLTNTDTVKERNTIKCDATLPGSGSIKFYCDLDDDDIYNENDDGQNIVCNYLEGYDISAYADWAGLRWMTELEYEKVCRGSENAVAEEYAWGTNSFTAVIDDVTNDGMDNEASNTTGANFNAIYPYPGGEKYQPVRVGIFATSSSNRYEANAGYYGVIDLSGNGMEPCITVGNSSGRTYIDNHGDGKIRTNGHADVNTWPLSGASTGSCRRGGSTFEAYVLGKVSNRYYGSEFINFRSGNNSLRLIRSAP